MILPTPAPVPSNVPAQALVQTARIAVPGNPFAAAFSADGNSVFVTIDIEGGGGVAVLKRTGDTYALTRFVAIKGTPGGLALSKDGATLVVTTGPGLAVLDAKALAGADDPRVRTIDDAPGAGSIDVAIAPNGYAFFTNEMAGTLGIADLRSLRVVAHVKLDSGPVGLAFTPDGSSLFVASEIASSTVSGRTCPVLHGPLAREGTIVEIDSAVALSNPAHAIKARAAAGCSPSRVAVTSRGDVAWVTARDDNALLAFDAAHFEMLPSNVPFSVGVGKAPIGLVLIDGDRAIAIANSDRFDGDAARSTLTVFDTAKTFADVKGATLDSVPTDAFPRDLARSRDGSRVVLTNYRGDSVQIFSVR